MNGDFDSGLLSPASRLNPGANLIDINFDEGMLDGENS
ncbi:MAG: hypothetical protein Ct9H300mP28_37770 [Pseudomonadota bacterium]|nr:MAG: hypothetical protein Ct9H300mP28_37770 [Pseudomonadota bacterium]